eukprot:COSAG06_NODE_1061_length_10874_cov_7.752390_2_plen_96_part_00
MGIEPNPYTDTTLAYTDTTLEEYNPRSTRARCSEAANEHNPRVARAPSWVRPLYSNHRLFECFFACASRARARVLCVVPTLALSTSLALLRGSPL